MADDIVQRFDFSSTTIRKDGLVNATSLIRAYKNATGKTKNLSQWLDSPLAKESVRYLSQAISADIADLVIVENGIGTWLHPDLAEILAQWISVEYRFAVVNLIRQEKESTIPAYQPSPLPPSDLAVKVARNVREIADLMNDNPRLAQALIDSAMNEVVAKALPAATLRGVAEIAIEMGHKVNASNRTKLGKFVASLQNFSPTKESRLCNGVMMPVNCYSDTPELRSAISSFFG